jgi:hypothetical protein
MQQQDVRKPYHVKALVHNIEWVLQLGDIRKLNKPTYQFITLHMGFIAHYNLSGFQAEYQDLRAFCRRLQTSEYSDHKDYTLEWADRYEKRLSRHTAYYSSVAAAIRRIVAVARRYEKRIATDFGRLERTKDIAQAARLLTRHGYGLPGIVKVVEDLA